MTVRIAQRQYHPPHTALEVMLVLATAQAVHVPLAWCRPALPTTAVTTQHGVSHGLSEARQKGLTATVKPIPPWPLENLHWRLRQASAVFVMGHWSGAHVEAAVKRAGSGK